LARLFIIPLFSLALLCCKSAFAERLIVPIDDKFQPPLVMHEDSFYSGIYFDLYEEILVRAGIQPEFLAMPKIRSRVMFEQGELLVACCGNPAWRKRPKEQEVQIFSDPFYHSKDVFIFPKSKGITKITDLTQLNDKKVAVKRGYGYRGEEAFGERVELNSESDLINFVALGRADIGIVNEDVVRNWMQYHGNKVLIGDFHDIATLHLRVHKTRRELLPKINLAIQSILQDGTLEKIRAKYLNSESANKLSLN